MFKRYILFVTPLFALAAVVIYIFSLNIQKERHQYIADSVRSFFDTKLNAQKSNALTLSILLAQNEALKEALLDLDEERGHEILAHSLQFLKRYTFIQGVRAQVIAKDLTIFARSWDKEFAGMPLEGFRKDLSNFNITKPKVSIETGRLLTIKATAPLRKGYKIIGYMEIISFFEPLVEQLRDMGIELFVLMRDRYLDVATLMRENPEIQHFVIANRNYNTILSQHLYRIDFQKLQSEGVVYDGTYLFVHRAMMNSRGENLGMFVLILDQKTLRRFEELHKNLSFFLNFNQKEFAKIVPLWEHPQGAFRSVYDKSVIEFLSKSEESELKEAFEQEARELLRNYSKEELIDIILQKYRRQKKQGAIE